MRKGNQINESMKTLFTFFTNRDWLEFFVFMYLNGLKEFRNTSKITVEEQMKSYFDEKIIIYTFQSKFDKNKDKCQARIISKPRRVE